MGREHFIPENWIIWVKYQSRSIEFHTWSNKTIASSSMILPVNILTLVLTFIYKFIHNKLVLMPAGVQKQESWNPPKNKTKKKWCNKKSIGENSRKKQSAKLSFRFSGSTNKDAVASRMPVICLETADASSNVSCVFVYQTHRRLENLQL